MPSKVLGTSIYVHCDDEPFTVNSFPDEILAQLEEAEADGKGDVFMSFKGRYRIEPDDPDQVSERTIYIKPNAIAALCPMVRHITDEDD